MSQLILHVTTVDQERAGLAPRAVTPGQTRQVGNIARLQIEGRVAREFLHLSSPIVLFLDL